MISIIIVLKILCHWKSIHNWYTIFTSGCFCVLWSRFLPKRAMEAKKLKSITMLPLRFGQKEPKKARKCQTLIFKLEGQFFACRVVFGQHEDSRLQFLNFCPKKAFKSDPLLSPFKPKI